MTAHIRRAPGKMPWELQIACSDCGYVGPIHDVNAEPTRGYMAVHDELAKHTCDERVEQW